MLNFSMQVGGGGDIPNMNNEASVQMGFTGGWVNVKIVTDQVLVQIKPG